MIVRVLKVECILDTDGTIVDCETPKTLCSLCKYYNINAFIEEREVTASELTNLIKSFNYVIKIVSI